jgi:eukaryotic-like serine/threonine-protein kinase
MAKRTSERLIVDRYALARILGRGGMGVVWHARDVLLDRDVAIKEVQLPPSLNSDEQQAMRARVLREARAAARLNHPNVVTLYDVVLEEGQTFIVMELVEAPTLAAVVHDRGPLPPDEVAAIGLQVLDALRAAHRVGIVHRDVKPGNVMVPPGEGRAKLADFGIASLAGDPRLTSTGLVLGSPAYMAPEQANGSLAGPAVDLWALGATMYFAVEGEPPFERGAAVPTLTAVVNDPPRQPRRAGRLEPVLRALLAKAPEERPSAGQLRPQLERIAGGGARRVTPTVVLPSLPEDGHPTKPLPAGPPPAPSAADAPTTPAEAPTTPEAADAPTTPEAAEAPTTPAEAAEAEGQAAEAAAPPEAETRAEPEAAAREQAEPPTDVAAEEDRAGAEAAEPEGETAADAEEPATEVAAEADQAVTEAPEPRAELPAPTVDTRPPAGSEPRPAPVPPRHEPAAAEPAYQEPAWPPATQRPPLPTPGPVAPPRSRAPLLLTLFALALVGVALAGILVATIRSHADRGQGSSGASGGSPTTGAPGTTGNTPSPPAGFRQYSNPQRGYAVAYPSGWSFDEKRSKFNTTVFSDGGSGRTFAIYSSKPPTPDLLGASRRWEQTVSRRNGFHLIRQNQATYHGRPAVITEYTYDGRGGRLHERHVNVDFGTWGYAVVATTTDGDWAAADRDVFRVVEQTLHTP